MTKLIILNGPKGCGKSVLTKRIIEELSEQYSVVESRCKDRLFEMTMQFFRLTPDEFYTVYNDRELKEQPSPLFPLTKDAVADLCGKLKVQRLPCGISDIGYTVSVRHAMIYVSECVAKRAFGQEYFGICRAETLSEAPETVFIDDSALGSMDEINPAMALLGSENVVIVRIFGRGDFSEDSRKYIDERELPADTKLLDITNTLSEEDFLSNAMNEIWKAL